MNPIPSAPPLAPPGLDVITVNMLGAVKWGGLVLAVLCLIIVAGAYAVKNQRGEGGQLFTGLIGVVALIGAIAAGGAIVGWLAGYAA